MLGIMDESRILILDHDRELVFSMWQNLTSMGSKVDCAFSLDEGEMLWNRIHYGVIITDLRLKGIHEDEGLELVTYLRVRCPSSRILLLTCYDSEAIAFEARRRGADGFLRCHGGSSVATPLFPAFPLPTS